MTISKDSPDVSVIEDRRLSCGVRLLVESNPSVKSAAISWWVPTGTMDDPDGDNEDGDTVDERDERDTCDTCDMCEGVEGVNG